MVIRRTSSVFWGMANSKPAVQLGKVRGHPEEANSLRGYWSSTSWNQKTTWQEFLKRHWELIVAADFFTTEVWTSKGLTRYLVLFFIDLSTRKVEIAGIASRANGLWMSQVGRHTTDAVDGILNGKRFLIQ